MHNCYRPRSSQIQTSLAQSHAFNVNLTWPHQQIDIMAVSAVWQESFTEETWRLAYVTCTVLVCPWHAVNSGGRRPCFSGSMWCALPLQERCASGRGAERWRVKDWCGGSGIRSQSKPWQSEISLAVRLQRGTLGRKEEKNEEFNSPSGWAIWNFDWRIYQPNITNLTHHFSAFNNRKPEKSLTVQELAQKHWPQCSL